jgi:hypothetical protein
MIRVLGSPRKLCDGFTRRDWLQVGSLGFLGLGLSDFLRLSPGRTAAAAEATAVRRSFGRARSCILLLPYGSPPQQETLDPKPDAPAEVRGELGAIPTSVPGAFLGEYLPHIARIMDRLTVVRSMTHPFPVHCTAYVVSGIPEYTPALETQPLDPRHWPFIGSVVDYVEERRTGSIRSDIPQNMALPWKMNSRGGPQASAVTAGPYAAFLGPAYDPVLTDFEGRATREIIKVSPKDGPQHKVLDPYAGIDRNSRLTLSGVQAADGISLNRQVRRRSLARQMESARRALESGKAVASFDRFQEMAYSLIATARTSQALDVRREPASIRDLYGMTLFGQSCLTARRLVEAGVKFVTVFWDEYAYLNTDWDTHWDHYDRLKGHLLPGFDRGFSGLILDLEQRGLLDETLVVWMSEHGRTPRLNNARGGGRDHWSRAYAIALAGAGLGAGNVVGRSDRIGADVASTPVSPKDILATILHLLGIDPTTTIPDRFGQPKPVVGTGAVRSEFFT